jgi:cephalosporin hydroxylase
VTPHDRRADGAVERLVTLALDELQKGHAAAGTGVARVACALAPDHAEIVRILARGGPNGLAADATAVDAVPYHLALGEAHRTIGDEAAAAGHFRRALEYHPDLPSAHHALAEIRMPGPGYLTWLERIYRTVRPASVLEVGVFQGTSLALVPAQTIAIGVDPAPRILEPPSANTHLFPETSDAFFANGRARSLLGDRPLSIGFIDGLHLFEQALRDFIGLEALCGPDSVIVLHDTIPLDEATQTREPRTRFHTGDVWRTVLCLKHFRPELRIATIATPPSGLTIVTRLDPRSRVLSDRYDEAVAHFLDVPFAAVDADRAAMLSIVPNEWSAIEPLLAACAASARDAEPAPVLPVPPPRAIAIGSFVVDRDQPVPSSADAGLVERFHALYYDRWQGGADTITLSWFGHQTLKCPLDLWIYQELLVRTRPDLVVETGTWRGGSALYLAMMLDGIGHGRVITIDVEPRPGRPVHPRIEYVVASSTAPSTLSYVGGAASGKRVMVILDSDHRAAHVYDELVAYAPMVTAGCYLVVEDTSINGHPVLPGFGPGPMEALERFLAENDAFEIDRRCERFLMTLNPKGYLRRKAARP